MFESELPVSNLVKRTILKILNLADASTPLVSNLVKRTILKIYDGSSTTEIGSVT